MTYWIGAVSAVTFIVVFLLDGWTRRAYSSIRHPVSALALGQRGWVQTANFIICGIGIAVGAAGILVSGVSFLLGAILGIFGLSLILSGIFRMDPMLSYPEGAPAGIPHEHSRHHALHDSAGAGVFLSLPAAAMVAAFVLPDPFWQVISGTMAIYLIVCFVLFDKAWTNASACLGLVQRAFIIPGWIWLGALFLALVRVA